MNHLHKGIDMSRIEKWIPVVGFEPFYEVSNHGRIRSLDRVRNSVNLGGDYSCIRPGKMLKPQLDKYGYFRLGLTDHNGDRTDRLIHRLVADAFIGLCPDNCNQINHKDSNKTNNVPINLEWCDGKRNQRHSYRNGTHTLNLHRCPITGRVLKKGTKLTHDQIMGNPYTGTSWNKQRKKWYAYLTVNGKRFHLGGFNNRDNALAAREKAEGIAT